MIKQNISSGTCTWSSKYIIISHSWIKLIYAKSYGHADIWEFNKHKLASGYKNNN